MTKAFRAISSFFAVLICCGSAVAYVYPGQPECPWATPGNTWAKFLNNEYPSRFRNPLFSVRMTRSIGDLEGGQCYTMNSKGNQNWEASGKIRNKNPHTSKVEIRNGGDPVKYEINIWGGRFTFNEAGEVYLTSDGQLAGNLYCHIGNECWK